MNICFFFYDSYLIRKSWAVLFQIYPLLSNFTVLTTANICLVVSWFHDPATREIILKYRFRWSHTSLSLPPIYFWDSGFHSPGWPWTPPPSPSASIYQVRGTQECATMLNLDHITLLSKAFLLLSISIIICHVFHHDIFISVCICFSRVHTPLSFLVSFSLELPTGLPSLSYLSLTTQWFQWDCLQEDISRSCS